jgi:CRP-like cAMP-binding protein
MGYEALELLDQLRGEEVDWIISNATPLTLLASATLIQDGAPGGYIYFITDGLFDVLVRNAFGQELRVAQLGPGQIVGEISWLDRRLILQPSRPQKAAQSSLSKH